MKKLTFSLLVLILLLAACSPGATPTSTPEQEIAETYPAEIVAEGKLLPVQSAELAFAQTGIVKEVLVEPGQEISTGQVIARLQNIELAQAELVRAETTYLLAEQAFGRADAEALSALAAANKAVRMAQQEFDNFHIPSDFKDMTIREALVYTHKNLEDAREAFKPYKDLKLYRGTAKIYKTQLDDAWAEYNRAIRWAELEANLERAKENLEATQRELDRLQTGGNAEEMSIARAQYESAYANLTSTHAALGNYELRAPFDGMLLRLDLTVGESVSPGTPVAFIADTDQWLTETINLAEIDIAKVVLNAPATVQLDAFPGDEFVGKVVEIESVGREYLGDMTYKVTILLDDSDERFMWNMTAIVTIKAW